MIMYVIIVSAFANFWRIVHKVKAYRSKLNQNSSPLLPFRSEKGLSQAHFIHFLKALIISSSKLIETSSEENQTGSELISTSSELIFTSSELNPSISELTFTRCISMPQPPLNRWSVWFYFLNAILLLCKVSHQHPLPRRNHADGLFVFGECGFFILSYNGQ